MTLREFDKVNRFPDFLMYVFYRGEEYADQMQVNAINWTHEYLQVRNDPRAEVVSVGKDYRTGMVRVTVNVKGERGGISGEGVDV